MDGTEVDLSAVTANDIQAASGVAHSDVLLAFADAIVAADDRVLQHTRHGVLEAMGPEAMVDSAGVASNFERMVRIADATGIPLDDRMAKASKEVRETLELERFLAFKESD
ncbi:MAG: hypothetical protein ETSY2_22680 [Candidatus Entotheonella gemina]|uniref:Uncharacterized protein n=1 Tax=Candidatus Entotheonella gemina TaxID=1429439 RepID=W4M5K5_9BACT|nr:MAG: hypothetical protein ETSY2_22680 [Candidatus Entotheonella gemina]